MDSVRLGRRPMSAFKTSQPCLPIATMPILGVSDPFQPVSIMALVFAIDTCEMVGELPRVVTSQYADAGRTMLAPIALTVCKNWRRYMEFSPESDHERTMRVSATGRVAQRIFWIIFVRFLTWDGVAGARADSRIFHAEPFRGSVEDTLTKQLKKSEKLAFYWSPSQYPRALAAIFLRAKNGANGDQRVGMSSRARTKLAKRGKPLACVPRKR